VLYSFQGGSDGSVPYVGVVIGSGGVLYGTTSGAFGTICPGNCGTVFSLTPPTSPGGSWTEAVLHNFTSDSDGNDPEGVVIGSGGVLYGTTFYGGTSSNGTVFSLTPPTSPGGSWTKAVLHNFSGNDGANPSRIKISKNGVLYGTTYYGGTSNAGTVFALKP
jgi:uncharacterized repeat protein (TIGR03803 family)